MQFHSTFSQSKPEFSLSCSRSLSSSPSLLPRLSYSCLLHALTIPRAATRACPSSQEQMSFRQINSLHRLCVWSEDHHCKGRGWEHGSGAEVRAGMHLSWLGPKLLRTCPLDFTGFSAYLLKTHKLSQNSCQWHPSVHLYLSCSLF